MNVKQALLPKPLDICVWHRHQDVVPPGRPFNQVVFL